MNVLVTGGSASGKSAYAERLACSLSPTRTYLATMSPHGREAAERIRRHRAQRAAGGFVTVECAGAVPQRRYEGVVLLDDLGNLVAQALFMPDATMADPTRVLERLDRELAGLFARADHVVVVGNEVGAEGRSPFEGTRAWVKLMGALSCRVAARACAVVEVACGLPRPVKGVLPCR